MIHTLIECVVQPLARALALIQLQSFLCASQIGFIAGPVRIGRRQAQRRQRNVPQCLAGLTSTRRAR